MKFYPRLVIAAFVMKMLSVSVAVDAAPIATSTIVTDCGLVLTGNRPIGPLPVALEDSCAFATSTALGEVVAVSNVKTGFGTALPRVGNVEATASVNTNGTDPLAPVGTFIEGEAEASGSVTFYFTVEEIRTPPATYVPNVYFEANGFATLEGTETNNADFNFEGDAAAFVILPDGTRWGVQGIIDDPGSSSWSDAFARSINLDLAPNDFANPFYEVTLGAGCYVRASTGGDFTSTAECRAFVDPTIRFDQAAFDAQYGPNSFTLSDYYALEFSENVGVVPVPAAVWLFGSGLLGLIGMARRKKAA